MCNPIDLDKQFNKYIIEQFNKLINVVIEYDKLDSRDKLNFLLDLDAAKDTDDSDHDDPASTYNYGHGAKHLDDGWADDLDGLVGNNPYNH